MQIISNCWCSRFEKKCIEISLEWVPLTIFSLSSALASNTCFNIKTGMFATRIDFMEAATSSVGRGTLLTTIGTEIFVSRYYLTLTSTVLVQLENA